MLAALELENFRAFEQQKLEFRPITVLLGPNNSGKSSVLASIRLLVQTLQSLDYQVPLLLNGSLGDFGTYKDVIYGNDRRHRLRIGLGFRMLEPPAGRRTSRSRIQSPPSPEALWDQFDSTISYLGLKYRYRTRRRELILDDAELKYGREHLLTVAYSDDADRHLPTRLGTTDISGQLRSRLARDVDLHHFLPRAYPFVFSEDATLSEQFTPDPRLTLRRSYDLSVFLWELLEQHVEYVGPMRLPPQRTYQHTGEAHSRVGGRGENWAAILARELIADNGGDIVDALQPWLEGSGLASDIEVAWLSDRQYEIRVTHPVTGESENLADVGQGNSQVLPVLIGGLHLGPGSVFMVEEPEIHLHPHAQAELGDFFRDLYRRGVQSLIETHSEYLVLRLQQHVAAGDIPADAVRFYYVSARGKRKYVRAMELRQDASFTSPLPHGFFPQRYTEPRRLARIRGQAAVGEVGHENSD